MARPALLGSQSCRSLDRATDAAHQQGIYCILDIILNHAVNVSGYRDARYQMSVGEDKWLPDPRWDGQPYRLQGFRCGHGKAALPFDPADPAALDAAWPDGAIWPRELQAAGSFVGKARITIFAFPPEYSEGDFYDFTKLNLAVDWCKKCPTPSSTLQHLIHCYEYWIAYADLDGFRIDAIKHMGQESTRIFCYRLSRVLTEPWKGAFLFGRRGDWRPRPRMI